MSANVVLTLLIELGKRYKMRGLSSIKMRGLSSIKMRGLPSIYLFSQQV